MSESKILFPNKEVKVGEETITVRELLWSDGMEFLRRISKVISEIPFENGMAKIDLTDLSKFVTQSTDLATFLLTKATGKTEKELPIGAGLDLLDVALELNLNQELLDKAKKLGARFPQGGLMTAAAKLTTSSSTRDTAAPTSTAPPSAS